MNYCEKIHYTILNTEPAEFAVMVDDLLSQLPQNEVIMRLAFFGTPGTNEEYVARRVLLREKIRRYYGDCEPALSYVSQPPLNAPLLMEVHSYVPDALSVIIKVFLMSCWRMPRDVSFLPAVFKGMYSILV